MRLFKFTLFIFIIMGNFGCRAEKQRPDSTSLLILERLGIIMQFDDALQAYSPAHMEQIIRNKNTPEFADYKKKYFSKPIQDTLVVLFQKQFNDAEIEKFSKMIPEDIHANSPDKFDRFERDLEDLYDAIYTDATRLISGIHLNGQQPDPSKPFAFFSVDRPDGIYVVEGYDSYMPQNMKIPAEPFLASTQIKQLIGLELAHNMPGLRLTVSEETGNWMHDNLPKKQDVKLLLVNDGKAILLMSPDPDVYAENWTFHCPTIDSDTFDQIGLIFPEP